MTLLLLAALPCRRLFLSVLPATARRAAAWTSAFVALAACAILIALAPKVVRGEVLRWVFNGCRRSDSSFAFRLDGLAWLIRAADLRHWRADRAVCRVLPRRGRSGEALFLFLLPSWAQCSASYWPTTSAAGRVLGGDQSVRRSC